MQLSTYLNFDGQCEAAFKFYRQCLGGEIVAMMPFGKAPVCDQVSTELHDKIMHACLVVDDQMLMGSDTTPEYPYEGGVKGAHIAINVDTPEEAERLFKDLSENGAVLMPLEETFWAVCFGIVVDQFNVPWMINCEKG